MRKISFFLLMMTLLVKCSCIFAQVAAVGKFMGTATNSAVIGQSMRPSNIAIGEPIPDMQKPQRVPGGVLIFNKTEAPVNFSIGFETISSTPGKIKSDDKSYYTPGRAFISGVTDLAGKFFPVKLYARDGFEIKEAIKYLKNRPGEVAVGAVHYELTKENNQYVLREMQPGLPPVRPTPAGGKVPQLSGHDPALPVPQPVSGGKEETKPQLSRPDPAPVRPQMSTPDMKPVEK